MAAGRRPLRPSTIAGWPEPFDPATELDWGRPDYSRRLLDEHLDQSHDGASRRLSLVRAHVRRIARLLPRPPARVVDAGCGPGLYANRLATLGYDVLGVDVGPSAVRHARRSAASSRPERRARFIQADLRTVELPPAGFDAALLVYFVLEAFPRAQQRRVLRRLAAWLRPGGRLIAELRLRPDQPPGRTTWWDVVPASVLAARQHLLLGDACYDPRRHTYVLRETAVLDDGSVRSQQTSAWLCPYSSIPSLFADAGFAVERMYDGWGRHAATALSQEILVVAGRNRSAGVSRRREPPRR